MLLSLAADRKKEDVQRQGKATATGSGPKDTSFSPVDSMMH